MPVVLVHASSHGQEDVATDDLSYIFELAQTWTNPKLSLAVSKGEFTDSHESDCIVDVFRSDKERHNREPGSDIGSGTDPNKDSISVYSGVGSIDLNGIYVYDEPS